jgi:hypothetical protein
MMAWADPHRLLTPLSASAEATHHNPLPSPYSPTTLLKNFQRSETSLHNLLPSSPADTVQNLAKQRPPPPSS